LLETQTTILHQGFAAKLPSLSHDLFIDGVFHIHTIESTRRRATTAGESHHSQTIVMAATIPLPSKASLVQQYVGKSLNDVPLPAAVLDIAAVKRNCKKMLDVVGGLGWEPRVGVTGHKVSNVLGLVYDGKWFTSIK
jgi:hypothetical protein